MPSATHKLDPKRKEGHTAALDTQMIRTEASGLPLLASMSWGMRARVKACGPRTFVAHCISYPSSDLLPDGGSITPALFTNMSSLDSFAWN
jgi:hypothetical protein